MATASLTDRIGLALRVLREGHAAMGSTIDPDDELYSRITGEKRDLNPIQQDRAREIAFYLWRQNPVARRLTEMIVDFVVGDGLTLGAVDDKVLEVITEFWTDPMNKLDERHRDIVRDQSLAGELALRVYTAETGGRTRIGIIDPPRISRVEKHPENALVDQTLVLRGRDGDTREVPVALITVDEESDPSDPHLAGDAFYFPVNRPLLGHRGTPDLLALADWIDGYDQILWNVVDRSAFQNAFVWDVTLTGSDQTQVDEWVRLHGSAPRPGTVRAHNEKEAWEAVSPDLGAAQVDQASRLIKNLILGGAGVPEGWFADADASNRSALTEQGDPTYKMLKRRQTDTKAMFEALLDFVVQQAIDAGRLPTTVDRTVVVNIPEASTRDVTGLAAALPQLQTALDAAVAGKSISRKSAREVFLSVASQLGIELDPEDEEEQIEEETEEAEAEAAERDEQMQAQAGMAAALAATIGGPTPPAGPTSPPAGPQGPSAPNPVAEATAAIWLLYEAAPDRIDQALVGALIEHANHKAMGRKGSGGGGGGGGGMTTSDRQAAADAEDMPAADAAAFAGAKQGDWIEAETQNAGTVTGRVRSTVSDQGANGQGEVVSMQIATRATVNAGAPPRTITQRQTSRFRVLPSAPAGFDEAADDLEQGVLVEHSNHRAMGPKGGGGSGGGGGGGGAATDADKSLQEDRSAMKKGERYSNEAGAANGMSRLRTGDDVRVELNSGTTIRGTVDATPKKGAMTLRGRNGAPDQTVKAGQVSKITLLSNVRLP